MADPRNVAHDKKVQEEKKHHGEAPVPDASETPQPGKKPTLVQNDSPGGQLPAARQVGSRLRARRKVTLEITLAVLGYRHETGSRCHPRQGHQRR